MSGWKDDDTQVPNAQRGGSGTSPVSARSGPIASSGPAAAMTKNSSVSSGVSTDTVECEVWPRSISVGAPLLTTRA